MKVLSITKASSVDWRHRELCIGPKPVATKGQKVRVFSLSAWSVMLTGQA